MKNVMVIECRDGEVILTDFMGAGMAVPGTLKRANLADAWAVVETADR